MLREDLARLKPLFKRLLAAMIICSPVVALTNNQRAKVKTQKAVEKKIDKKSSSFQDDRCLGIQPPRS